MHLEKTVWTDVNHDTTGFVETNRLVKGSGLRHGAFQTPQFRGSKLTCPVATADGTKIMALADHVGSICPARITFQFQLSRRWGQFSMDTE
jgi:hypothetical protein